MFRAAYLILCLSLCTITLAQTTPAATPPDSQSLVLVKNFPIEYPAAALTANAQGAVSLKISVSENGDVTSADVVSGDPVLGAAAVDAAKHWEFAPFIRNGKPTKASTTVPINFSIGDGKCTNNVRQGTVTTPFDRPVTVSQDDLKQFVCKNVPPVMSHLAEQARIRGDVVMTVIISKEGIVQTIRVVNTASPMLNGSAIEAVKQSRFRPYLVSNEPVIVSTTITIRF